MKTSKVSILSTSIIALALVAVVSLLSWLIPFPNHFSATFITTYACTVVMIIAEALLVIFAFLGNKNKDIRILGLPIIHAGLVFTIIQVVLTAIFYLLNSLISEFPVWVVILVECLLYLVAIIVVVIGFYFKHRVKEFKENEVSTKNMKLVEAKITIAVSLLKGNDALYRKAEDLFYSIKGSDHTTNDMSLSAEVVLIQKVEELYNLASKGASENDVLAAINEVQKALLERNTLCKLGK